MRRSLLACGIWVAVTASPALAQDGQTLADIRQELSVLFVDVQRLKTELSTTGSPSFSIGGDTALARIDAVERELRRLTAQTEALELRVQNIVSDGSNKIGDLEFRLCELEADCDIATLGAGTTLGGEAAPAPQPPASSGSGTVVLGEQGDFDRAKAAFDAGDMAAAATAFDTFIQTYPGGPFSADAHFYRGEALAAGSDWPRAARAYLDAFTFDTDGPRAPGALLKLGLALSELGQSDEACLTLAEVPIRYPQSPAALDAASASANLGCT